ncbi:MAG: M24 family metallopeptidase [Gaiellales bacterium]
MARVFKDPRKREYLNAAGADRPLVSPIPHSTLVAARGYRKRRLVEQVARHGCTAILLFDPTNIRYALDAANMQVWAAHNPFHYALVFADGHAIDFEYRGSEHVVRGLETIDEIRPAYAWFYMYSAENLAEWVDTWAREIVDALRERTAGDLRLAVDKLEPPGVDALRRYGVTLVEGQELTEHARMIKSPQEIELMRWTLRVCEAGMARMYEQSVAGRTEQEIWAELHHENIRSGGGWLETRLLAVGERTNPWFQECSGHVAQSGDMLAFDTDMIGPYGYCADLSRSWTIDHVDMTAEQRSLYAAAREQIEHNLALIEPGMDFREYSRRSWPIPHRYLANRYSCLLHGVGLSDEYPAAYAPQDAADFQAGVFQPGMVVCVESLIGEQGGREAVKLETQALVTDTGAERLDSFPWEDV